MVGIKYSLNPAGWILRVISAVSPRQFRATWAFIHVSAFFLVITFGHELGNGRTFCFRTSRTSAGRMFLARVCHKIIYSLLGCMGTGKQGALITSRFFERILYSGQLSIQEDLKSYESKVVVAGFVEKDSIQ